MLPKELTEQLTVREAAEVSNLVVDLKFHTGVNYSIETCWPYPDTGEPITFKVINGFHSTGGLSPEVLIETLKMLRDVARTTLRRVQAGVVY